MMWGPVVLVNSKEFFSSYFFPSFLLSCSLSHTLFNRGDSRGGMGWDGGEVD